MKTIKKKSSSKVFSIYHFKSHHIFSRSKEILQKRKRIEALQFNPNIDDIARCLPLSGSEYNKILKCIRLCVRISWLAELLRCNSFFFNSDSGQLFKKLQLPWGATGVKLNNPWNREVYLTIYSSCLFLRYPEFFFSSFFFLEKNGIMFFWFFFSLEEDSLVAFTTLFFFLVILALFFAIIVHGLNRKDFSPPVAYK